MAIKDLFIKSDDAPQNVAQNTVATSTPVVNPTVTYSPSAQPVNAIASNDEIVGKIWDAIIEKNLPGPDYLELKNNVSALEDLPLTDEQKLVSAFKILKKNYPNFTKDVILRSIDTYIGIVNEEKNEGLTEVAKLRAEKVESNEALIDNLRTEAMNLKAEYDAKMKQIDELTVTVSMEKQTLLNKENVFVSSVDTVLNTLNTDKSKISTLNI